VLGLRLLVLLISLLVLLALVSLVALMIFLFIAHQVAAGIIVAALVLGLVLLLIPAGIAWQLRSWPCVRSCSSNVGY
jgi:hypothetical protein